MRKEACSKFYRIWNIIELPVLIIVIYNLLELAFSITTYVNKLFPAWILNVAITLFAFGLIGYNASREEKNPTPGKYGAYAGLITGFVGAVIGILTYYFFPEKIAEALQIAAQSGADMATVQTFMKISLYAGLVISPAVNAAIGAFLAWISAMIFKKK
jgi:hypothetical protein